MPSDASALRMIEALLAETTEEWQSRKIAPAQNGSYALTISESNLQQFWALTCNSIYHDVPACSTANRYRHAHLFLRTAKPLATWHQ